jgi:hypothetical protein
MSRLLLHLMGWAMYARSYLDSIAMPARKGLARYWLPVLAYCKRRLLL